MTYTPHELLLRTNHHLICGGTFTDTQKTYLVRRFHYVK